MSDAARDVSAQFPKANHTLRVYNENWISNLWENPCCCCLMHVTILPCLLLRCYRGTRHTRHAHVAPAGTASRRKANAERGRPRTP